MTPKVFIAGPFTAPSPWRIILNVRMAEMLALKVWRAGAIAYCPHLNTQHFFGVVAERTLLVGHLEMLQVCQALITTDHWESSKGAQAEVAEARLRGIPVFHTLDDLQLWLRAQGVPADG